MKQSDAPIILSKLRKKLIDNACHDLRSESIALYQHVEKTLLAALREHYEQKKQKDTTSNRESTSKLERGLD